MGKGIVYSIGTEGCPCCGCQERAVGCHGKCDRYKAWDGKRQAERQERIKRASILHEADKRKSAAVSHYKRRGAADMNKVILMGRLTSDPKMDWTRSEDSKQYATYTLAINRRFKKNGQADTDFISCIAWGAMAEFAEKFMKKVPCSLLKGG